MSGFYWISLLKTPCWIWLQFGVCDRIKHYGFHFAWRSTISVLDQYMIADCGKYDLIRILLLLVFSSFNKYTLRIHNTFCTRNTKNVFKPRFSIVLDKAWNKYSLAVLPHSKFPMVLLKVKNCRLHPVK